MGSSLVAPMRHAIDHLPPGGMMVMDGVSWDDYERLLDELSHDRPGVRVTYNQGRLQAVSPLRAHEHFIRVVSDIATCTADAFGLPLEDLGATTMRQPGLLRGLEPDLCFYVANAHRIEGRITLDLATDPPPDLAVEIDMSNDSAAKLPIYVTLGVPEIWIYNGRDARILRLNENRSGYTDASISECLPRVTAEFLTEHLEAAKTTSQSQLRRDLRAKLGR